MTNTGSDRPERSTQDPEPLGERASEHDLLIQRSFIGATWMLVLSASAMLFGFGTNVVLGQAGPTTLGFYTFLIATYSLVTTFFVLGGNHVIVTYLPVSAADQRVRFVLTYSFFVTGFAALLLLFCLSFPGLVELLYGQSLDFSPLPYVVIFVPIAVGQALVWSVLQATMRFRSLSVSQQLVSVLTFFFLLITAVRSTTGFHNGLSLTHRSIAVAVAAANVAAIIFPAVQTVARSRGNMAAWWRPYLPTGVPSFALYFHGSTLLYFLIRNADQFFVLRQLGLQQLGYYRAAFVLAQLVAWFSVTTDWIVYPALCNLPLRAYPQAYSRFARLNALGTGLVAAVVALFSREALGFFGPSAGPTSRTVLLLLVGSIAASAPFVSLNNSVLMARQRVRVVLYSNLAAATVGVAGYVLFGTWLGLLGVGIAFVILQLALLAVTAWLVSRESNIALPVMAVATSVVCFGWGLLGTCLMGSGWVGLACRAVMAALLLPLLVAARLIRWSELRELALLLRPRQIMTSNLP